ncbi:ABC transporter permease [Conexibacter sp. JD483]|uniref:ABC transporter permease n=1 Tax=unclassified Conexibacter TaxID=2627773 RepID=UPI00271A7DE9|nr:MULTISPECIES: ABC transporter permease [unclassified Conexibacter]MDO8184168.1 ABC transporter permease [Conexibacter sp. CPCC 205706]MDO8197160.1 ABC transporter permease [Conexibacter sp. CPCC 205762]MDR9367525.1 ABC transporter permease [Conexibacter sp. JD483]
MSALDSGSANGAPAPAPIATGGTLAERHRGLIALAGREVNRVLKLWQQTIAAPIVSSFLFILVFGLSLGSRIRAVEGVDYDVFIVPGLVTMAMVQAAYSNNSSSVFQARFDRYINDVLASPMKSWEVNLGLSLGGAVRAVLIGIALVLLALPVTSVPVHDPFVLFLAVVLSLVIFSSLGVIVGVYAQSWDHASFVQNIVIVPLSFLGGTFYSVDTLPSPWQEISHVNPLFFVINAVRYGFLGVSDVSVWLSLGVMAVLAAVMVVWSSWLFSTGRKLKA